MSEHLIPEIKHLLDLPDLSFPDKIAGIEKVILLDALERNDWVKTRVARELKIKVRALNYKFVLFNLQKPAGVKYRRRHFNLQFSFMTSTCGGDP